LPHPEESADPDDRVGHGFVGRDDEIVDHTDLLVSVVVHGLAHDLLLGAPPERHELHLFRADCGRAGARYEAGVPVGRTRQGAERRF